MGGEHGTDVLVFVEDPGAANYAMHLPEGLAKTGITTRMFADGHAKTYLAERGMPAEPVPEGKGAVDILGSVRPRLLMTGTSENTASMGLELIARSRDAGIVSIGLIDAPGNALYRFRGTTDESTAYAPDWLLVPDDATLRQYAAAGFRQDRIVPCGHPHYDHIRETGKRLAGMDRQTLRSGCVPDVPSGRRIVTFVSEISGGLNAEQFQLSPDHTLFGVSGKRGRTEIVIEEFLRAVDSLSERPYLVLRLHPKNTTAELEDYLGSFDHVSMGGSPIDLVYVSDLVVGMTSMLLMEAAILGVPTLSIVPRESEKASLPTIESGITPCVTTRDPLAGSLDKLLKDQQPETDRERFFYFGSMERIRDFVLRILEGRDAEPVVKS